MRRIFAILPLDENGSVLVEAAIMAPIIFMLVLGSMDLLFAFYEWNAAAKAVQVGVGSRPFPIRSRLGLMASVPRLSAHRPRRAAPCPHSR